MSEARTESSSAESGVAARAGELRRGAALVEARGWEVIELTGADRARFLNGLVTCDVESLGPAASAHGFVTEIKGHILADFEVLARGESLLLVVPPGTSGELVEHLLNFRVADRVESTVIAAELRIAAGPAAGERLAERLGLDGPPGRGETATFGAGGDEAVLYPSARFGDGTYGVVAPPTAWEALADRLTAAPAETALVPVEERAFDLDRIERGIPLSGIDYGRENFPQETGLEAAVSYTKGCYLGQEVVARIHYRGGVQKILRGVRIEGGAPPEVGVELVHDGRPVGRLTSVADSPRFGAIGLAIVHRRAAEPGTEIELASGGGASVGASVVELPFRQAAPA